MLSEMLGTLADTISHIIVTFGYVGIFAITFIENIIAPIPSEFVFPWAGYLASQGELNIWLISLAGAFGSLVAALVLYYLGTLFSGKKAREFTNKYGKYLFVSEKEIDRAQGWFDKYGAFTVLIFRFVPLGRTIVSIPAGFARMNIVTFTIYTFIGTFIWCFILTFAGYQLGENWTEVVGFLSKYQKIVILAILIGGVAILVIKRKSIKKLICSVVSLVKKDKSEQSCEVEPTDTDNSTTDKDSDGDGDGDNGDGVDNSKSDDNTPSKQSQENPSR